MFVWVVAVAVLAASTPASSDEAPTPAPTPTAVDVGLDGVAAAPPLSFDDAKSAVNTAQLAMALGDFALAAAAYAWAVDETGGHPTLVLQHAITLYYGGHFGSARDVLRIALEKDTGEHNLPFHRCLFVAADTRDGGGDAAASAKRHYELFFGTTEDLRMEFKDKCVAAVHGLFLGMEGQLDTAEQCLEQDGKAGVSAAYWLALYAESVGDLDASRRHVRKALESDFARSHETEFFVRAAEVHAIQVGAYVSDTCPCEDDLDFVDKYGDSCAAHAGYDCQRYVLDMFYDYSRADQQAMVDACPRSCGLCAETCAASE